MQVREAQSIGALTILVVSLIVYGGSLFNEGSLHPETSLPWVNQGPGMMAAEVTGTTGADGIYFLPERTSYATIRKVIGIEGKIEPVGGSLSDGNGYAICAEDGVMRISDMPAVRLLALGLPIDLNRASVEELSQVPGIGERLAAQMVQIRQIRGNYESLSNLTTIRGIKEKKLDNLKKYLIVRPAR